MVEVLTYYSAPKILLTMIGLWPYQNKRFTVLKNSFISLSFLLFIVAQCLVFKTRKFMLKYVSCVLMSLGSFARYNINWYQLRTAKKFMDKIKRDMEMEHGETLEIMKKHAYMGKIYGLRLGSVFYVSLVIIVLYYSSIFIYERIVPTNETRLRRFPVTAEYLILEEKCRLLTFLHMNFSMIICVTVFAGTEMLTILWLKHAIGLSEVTRNSKYQCDDRTRSDIAKAVIAHKRGLEFIKEIQDNNAFAYAVLLLFAITSLAINFFRLSVSQSELFSSECEEAIASILFIVGELVYMYYLNYLCEQAYDYYTNFSMTIFHDNWYETTVATQKLLLNMMLRTNKTFSFNVYNCYSGTVEGFSSLVKTSVSYFMMISSMQ